MRIDDWLEESLDCISPHCSKEELQGLNSRLNSACEKEFSRGVSELVVSSYFAQDYQDNILVPRGSKKDKDIDVSFEDSNIRFNIEVKCPDLSYERNSTFTLEMPYTMPDHPKSMEVAGEIGRIMGDMQLKPNKILNFRDLITDCEQKFCVSAGGDDFNIVLFSMLELSWMDDYLLKVVDENNLTKSKNIHAIVLSNAALKHRKSKDCNKLGLDNCLNYIAFNSNLVNITEAKHIKQCIPNQTDEFDAWWSTVKAGRGNIDIVVRRKQALSLFYNTAWSQRKLN
ncbi:hypothetical protein [uncultured Pseudoteredinibacter sp.]|uniref:hypothetical protein n=1 Tax=uncultured Pseudoteredinibacter sp. TaxID=1641701 RepID=UPI002628512E|nr:hypothetical protein [uncultured Pseudoteredinibacter sp.]